jgi:hypothetical protein
MTSEDALEKMPLLYPICSVARRRSLAAKQRLSALGLGQGFFPIGDILGKQLGKQKFSPICKSILLAAILLEHLVPVIIYDTATIYSANIYYFTKFL